MRKYIVLLYSGVVLLITWLGAYKPSYYLHVFISTQAPYVLVRCAVVLSLLAYALLPSVRSYNVRYVMGLGSAGLIALSFMAMVTPTFMGHFNYYIPIGDVFIWLE